MGLKIQCLTPLYSLALAMYGLAIRIVSPWNAKARAFVRGRANWRVDLQNACAKGEGDVVWFHCASLGEFEQGRPLMEAYKQRDPSCRLVISFFSPSGYEIRRNYPLAHYVCYLPMDGRRCSEDFVNILQPRVAFFVKYEVWYYYLKALNTRGIPSFLISALFPENHLIFTPLGSWYREVYRLFTHIFVQDAPSAERLRGVDFTGVTVSGDTRFDRVLKVSEHPERLEWLERFAGDNSLLVLGSTWPDDEVWLSTFWRERERMPKGWKLVIAPHEVEPKRIASLCRDMRGVSYQRYTDILRGEAVDEEAEVLVVDAVGKLLSIYAYATLAYVGGAYRTGLHNTLEPAAYGVGVVFGAHYHKFLEAAGLLAVGGAESVPRGEDLATRLSTFMRDAARCRAMGLRAAAFVKENAGACSRILRVLDGC